MIESAWPWISSPEWWIRLLGKILEIALIVLLARIALALARRILERAMNRMRISRVAGPSTEALERRARTLLTMVQSLITYVVLITTVLVILGRLGVPTGSLLTGGAIAGLAVTFGAQNLIRDFFTGIALLVEDAFTLGDRITVAGITGEVIEMGMRMVKLRGDDGTLHFIPYGAIQAVSNLSRASPSGIAPKRPATPMEAPPSAPEESSFEEAAPR